NVRHAGLARERRKLIVGNIVEDDSTDDRKRSGPRVLLEGCRQLRAGRERHDERVLLSARSGRDAIAEMTIEFRIPAARPPRRRRQRDERDQCGERLERPDSLVARTTRGCTSWRGRAARALSL